MIIQCRESLFQKILKELGDEYTYDVIETKYGIIDCFEKDWLFIETKCSDKLVDFICVNEEEQFVLVPDKERACIIVNNIPYEHRYIFVRYVDNKNVITSSYKSYINIEKGGNHNGT